MNAERSVRKMMIDFSRQDWSTKRYRERAEAEEFKEREQAAHERLRRAEQRDRDKLATPSSAWCAAIDQRIGAHREQSNQIWTSAVGEFVAATRAEIRKEFSDKNRELEAKIAQLERRLDALSQGKRESFQFARGRGHGSESRPARTVQKVH